MTQTEYGRAGLIGMLTPQGNTTVEPEFWAVLPPDWSMISARLVSDRNSIEDRLVDYADHYAETARRFANAPISVIAIGCTGVSYLVGTARERDLIAEIEDEHQKPCFTAGSATQLALETLQAKRIGLVSPYPKTLSAKSRSFWESVGFEVVAKTGPKMEPDKFHPIYGIPGAGTLAALHELQSTDCDAIVMLGTGLPTLGALQAVSGWDGPTPISCSLALAWASIETVREGTPSATSLRRWTKGTEWAKRFEMLFPMPEKSE